jgi:demethylmenaquinone methyltransferase/2-methoxy-6-polyprenyl-1,4-benzoquinol methylase
VSDAPVLPVGDEKRVMVESMFDGVAPRYDRLNRIISLGLDQGWRRRTVATLGLPAGARVIDLACGTGDLCDDVRAAGYRPFGFDVSAGMLAVAHTTAPLVRSDVLVLPVPDGSVDGVTCGFALRNFVDLPTFFAECGRVLRPGGRIAALDAAEPENPVMRIGNSVWFRGIVPWIGARFSDNPAAYRYLPASTAYLPPGPALMDQVRAAGFDAVGRRTMMGGSVQLLTATRADTSSNGAGA